VDLPAALVYLDAHVNLEATAGRVHGLSLERMRRLATVLGDPQHAYPVVHLTGTNGKGSTAEMVSALLAGSGLTVGTYSSPHLQRINERVARNGEAVDDDTLATLLGDVAAVEGVAGVVPSYFEILTAAAFRYFADVAVDVAVVEVGLLGRYDATNVADAAVAVVTNVGRDHSDFHGDWRAAVAREKAGIVKANSTLVLGETAPDVAPIFRTAGAAQVWERLADFACETNAVAIGGRLVDVRTPGADLEDVFLALHGAHQGENAAVALAAAEAFFGRPVDSDVARAALAEVSLPGRFEVVRRSPLVVLDGAHNPDGAAAAASTFENDFVVAGRRILVVGMLGPRPVADVLAALGAARADVVIACAPVSPRAVPAHEVAAAATVGDGEAPVVEVVADVGRAVDRALALADVNDAVLVTGSLYVVGAARTHLRGRR